MYNNVFFEYFTKRCGINLSSDQIKEDRKILREDTYTTNEGGDLKNPVILTDYYTENKVFGHIDLNIIGDIYTITIENKVDSGQHDDQCVSYYNYMNDCEYKHYKNNKGEDRDKYFVFLTKDIPKDYEYYGGLIPFEKDGKYVVKEEHSVKEYVDEYDNNEGKKLIYFNYRLISYEDTRKIIDTPVFIEKYEKEYEKNNEKVEFAKEIVEQYKGN